MGYESDFKSARKVRATALQKLKPSSTLEAFVGEEKMITLVKAIDSAGDDLKKFTASQGALELHFKVWMGKIRVQEKKEKGDQKAIGKIMDDLESDVKKLIEDAELKANRLRKAESVPENATAFAEGVAEVAKKKKLKAALDHFEERRNLHLAAVVKLSKETQEAGPKIRKWHETAAGAVGQALGLAKLGRLNDAMKVAGLAKKCADDAEILSGALKKSYEQRITETFQIDRNRGFKTYCEDRDFDLQEDQKAAFLKGQIAIAEIFTKAQHMGKEVLSTIEDYLLYAASARKSADEAESAAKMKDIRPVVLKGLQETIQKVEELAKSIEEQINTETKSGLSTASDEYLAQWKIESNRPNLRASMPPKITAWKAKVNALRLEVGNLENQTKMQIAKLPKDLSSETAFKSLSTKLLETTIQAKQAVTSFSIRADDYIKKMETLLG